VCDRHLGAPVPEVVEGDAHQGFVLRGGRSAVPALRVTGRAAS
jgi:hypothetical protein